MSQIDLGSTEQGTTVSAVGRYICEVCGIRAAAEGFCKEHPDEPLLDLSNEDVRLMLDEFDDRRKAKRYTVLTLVSAILTSPLLIVVGVISRKGALVAWAASTAGLTGGLYRFFPARRVLPDLESEWPDWMA